MANLPYTKAVTRQFTQGYPGDTIYACAAIKRMRFDPVEFYLNCRFNYWRQRMESLKFLLEIQPYFSKVEVCEQTVGFDLNRWLKHRQHGLNISDTICHWLRLPLTDHSEPWLSVPEVKAVAKVVVHRSPRHHNDLFPWRQAVEKYKNDMVFIGIASDMAEYEDFCERFGRVPHWPSASYLETAQII